MKNASAWIHEVGGIRNKQNRPARPWVKRAVQSLVVVGVILRGIRGVHSRNWGTADAGVDAASVTGNQELRPLADNRTKLLEASVRAGRARADLALARRALHEHLATLDPTQAREAEAALEAAQAAVNGAQLAAVAAQGATSAAQAVVDPEPTLAASHTVAAGLATAQAAADAAQTAAEAAQAAVEATQVVVDPNQAFIASRAAAAAVDAARAAVDAAQTAVDAEHASRAGLPGEDRRRVREAVPLPPPPRQAVVLRELEALSFRELAEVEGVKQSISTKAVTLGILG